MIKAGWPKMIFDKEANDIWCTTLPNLSCQGPSKKALYKHIVKLIEFWSNCFLVKCFFRSIEINQLYFNHINLWSNGFRSNNFGQMDFGQTFFGQKTQSNWITQDYVVVGARKTKIVWHFNESLALQYVVVKTRIKM